MIKHIGLVLASVMFFTGIANAETLDRRIRVYNETGKRIVELYASPVDQKDWTYNMIDNPSKIIRGHDVRVADIDDGTGYCMYDLRAVRADGEVAEYYGANVCVHPGQDLVGWHIVD